MKNFKFFALLFVSSFMLFSCAPKKQMTYNIFPKSDTNTGGTVTFSQKGKKVKMVVKATGLTPGEHAIHLHAIADCSSPDGMSTGGHWNPTDEDHGKWGHDMFHRGDIGNLVANENGVAALTFSTDKWCIGCSDDNKNILNTALIIHADKDDFHTQPTGNAGGRVGCAEIK